MTFGDFPLRLWMMSRTVYVWIVLNIFLPPYFLFLLIFFSSLFSFPPASPPSFLPSVRNISVDLLKSHLSKTLLSKIRTGFVVGDEELNDALEDRYIRKVSATVTISGSKRRRYEVSCWTTSYTYTCVICFGISDLPTREKKIIRTSVCGKSKLRKSNGVGRRETLRPMTKGPRVVL